jgi:phosphate transport system substrate-binding protein
MGLLFLFIKEKRMKLFLAVLTTICLAVPAFARDNIQVAGSSTVLPYATIVAESFNENYDFPAPVVEGGGSGAGRKKLCEGVGENTIDIANSSSVMKDEEYQLCADNGVTDVKEVRFGYDGIVFASDINGAAFALTAKDLYLALHASSTATTWNEVNPDLPNQEIMALIPGTKHGTREVFDVKVLEAGCKEVLGVEKLDDAQKEECHAVRTDGRAIDIDGDYTETLARLAADPKSIGVFGLSFYQNNMDKLQVATIDGVVPSVETISSGDYPISRPLFFYVKMQHIGVIPGLQEYVQFFLSDEMSGPDGALVQYGLVPDPELAATQAEWQ